MVAQFRLDKPNMSFVNMNSASSTTDEQGRQVQPVRGSILRGSSTTFIPDFMNVGSGLNTLIMGGAMPSDDSEEAGAPRRPYEGLSGSNVSSSTGSGGMSPSDNVVRGQSFGGNSSLMEPGQDGNVPRSNSTNNDALIMRRPKRVTARKQTQSFIQPNPYTLIRSTSTIEISDRPFDNNQNCHQYPNASSTMHQYPNASSTMHQYSNASSTMHQYSNASSTIHSSQNLYPISESQSNFEPTAHRRMGEYNPNVVKELIIKQEFLRRENEQLRRENEHQKRKLVDFANTFTNPDKLQKVVQLLAEKRKNH